MSGSLLIFLLLPIHSFFGCSRGNESVMIYQEDIYSMRITPEEFVLFLKGKQDSLYEFALDPKKISRKWIGESEANDLKKYLNDLNSCTEVVNINVSKTLSNKYRSSVKMETKKLLSIYYNGTYLGQKVND